MTEQIPPPVPRLVTNLVRAASAAAVARGLEDEARRLLAIPPVQLAVMAVTGVGARRPVVAGRKAQLSWLLSALWMLRAFCERHTTPAG